MSAAQDGAVMTSRADFLVKQIDDDACLGKTPVLTG
jgi:hypothetical protein